jgi:hypothetical protein
MIKFFIKLLLLFFSIIFLKRYLSYDFSSLGEIIKTLNFSYVFVSLILLLISFILGSYKWYLLFKFSHPNSEFKPFLISCTKAAFISNFMFGSLVADGYRVYDISKKFNVSYKTSLFFALLDRFLTLLFFILTVLILFFTFNLSDLNHYFFKYKIIMMFLFLFLFLFCLLSFVIINNFNIIAIINSGKFRILLQPKIVSLYFFLSFISIIFIGLTFQMLAMAINLHIPYLELPKILTGLLANYFPLSYSGWGVREIAVSFILKPYNTNGQIITTSILFGFLNSFIALPGIYFYFKKRKK